MDLPLLVVFLIGGLALLTVGGELLVRGATSIAKQLGLTTTVIGLTVVAMGTSLPELAVSLYAALGGTPDIAIGNVVGSNIANIGLILGITAMVTALPVYGSAVRLEWPFMFAASWVAVLLARDGSFDRLEGGFFLVSLILFVTFMVHSSRLEVKAGEAAEIEAMVKARAPEFDRRSLAVALLLVVVGSGMLFLGGKLLVDGAVGLARIADIPERVIGLTLVAVGTSLPELATSLVAAYRGHGEVAVANVIGSNIFNLLGILGITALVKPIPVAAQVIGSDLWWMLGIALLLLPMLRFRSNLSRVEGGVLLTGYLVYVALLW